MNTTAAPTPPFTAHTSEAARPPVSPRLSEQLSQALAALPSARRFSPRQRATVHRLAYTALAAGDTARAHRLYQWLVFYGGADSRAWRGLAAAAHALGLYGDALMHWTMVTMIEPGATDATLYAGRCQAQLGQLDEACRSFERVGRDSHAEPWLRQQATQLLALVQQRAPQA